jgi:Tol biopolymer transport system component
VHPPKRLRFAICLLAIANFSWLASDWLSTAEAAFPGANGRIAYAVDESGGGDLDNYWIETVLPDGTGRRRPDLSVADLAFSPDGRRIAYSDPFDGSIFSVDASGRGRSRRLSRAREFDGSPDWSPSGRRLVFARIYSSSKPTDVWVYYFGGARPLTQGTDPAWSIKGHIAFTREIGFSPVPGIYSIRPDGSQRRQVSPLGVEPDWSPTGNRIVFRLGSDIALMRADGSHLQRLTHGRAIDSQPSYAPNGRRIVFVRNDSTVLTMTTAGRDLKRVAKPISDVDADIRVFSPDWQPRPPTRSSRTW